MLKVLILICSIYLAPAECQVHTATAVIRGPDAVAGVSCGLQGQAYLAATGLAAGRDDTYLKIHCSSDTVSPSITRSTADQP